MGRSGGGGRSGGFSGGGRSSGGFSGGGRSSGGFSGGFGGGRSGGPSFGSGSGPSSHRHGGSGFGTGLLLGHLLSTRRGGAMPPNPVPPPSGGGPGQSPSPQGQGGCGCGCRTLAILFAAMLLLGAVLNAVSFCTGVSFTGDPAPTAPAPAAREPLPASAVVETGYYTDADGDWVHDPGQLERGLEEFYRSTGVQPYVYILPNGQTSSVPELTAEAERLYGELFSDEGHFLLVFCDDGQGSFNCGYTAGSLARSVMDDEAVSVLAMQLNRSYAAAATEELVFSEAFAKTAAAIMGTGSAATSDPSASSGQPTVETFAFSLVVIAAAIGVLVWYLVRKRRERRLQEQERTERILSTPLEKFGDQDVEDLARKYEESE